MDINTGALMKHFRHLEHGPRAESLAATFARQFGTVERVARIAVRAAHAAAEVLGHRTVTAVTNMARAVVSKDLMPGWLPNMPAAARAKLPKHNTKALPASTSPHASTASSAGCPGRNASCHCRRQ